MLAGVLDGKLRSVVDEWLLTTRLSCTPAGTYNNCASIAPVLAARLVYLKFPAKQLKVVGLRTPLGPYAHRNWKALEGKGQSRYFTHHAVLVGDMVVDPTGAQFGRTFPLYSPKREFLAKWDEAYTLDPTGRVTQELK